MAQAFSVARHPVTLAYLGPSAGSQPAPPSVLPPIASILGGPLRQVTPASARHLALVEAVRRLWRSHAMALDRDDKERVAGTRE